MRLRAPRLPLWALCGALLGAMAPGARAAPQEDPGLRVVLAQAIAATRCDGHDDRYGGEVFFKLHEPQLRRSVPEPGERLDILQSVYCEAQRITARYHAEHSVELHLTPELVLAVIDVESHFDRYAVSAAGAVGLMQVMPFWPRRLGVDNRLFGSVEFNVRMGCEILAYYLHAEHNDYRRALARYNGSRGRREYPDRVLARLADRWRG